MSDRPTIVDEWTLRKFFAEEVLPRVEANELIIVVVSRGVPDPEANMPAGTESQMINYLDKKTSELLATAHRYLLLDGNLGASGMPDPKYVRVGDNEYKVPARPLGKPFASKPPKRKKRPPN